ncbi:hypothetical protein [Deinococcus sp.]|uniref:hypothetical protein n=1 Tax=Deinococcus sp. TaxID=47478 RepID=UPI00391CAEA7
MTNTVEPPVASVGLRWTGNYMMDMAVAGLLAFAGKREPQNIDGRDLHTFQRWAETHYFAPELTSWISVVFTSNFLNPSFSQGKKLEVLRGTLTSYQRPGLLDVPCAFFPEQPAQQRVARDLLPMLMGRGPMNFYPDGQPGLPLSGLAITALQGLSMAAPLVSGRALLIDADDPEVLKQIVSSWQGELTRRAEMSLDKGERLDIWASPRTRLIEVIRKIIGERIAVNRDVGTFGSVTLYHLSNSGQGPDVRLYTLQQPALSFLGAAQRRYGTTWTALTRTALHSADKGKDERYGTRNDLDEALFGLPAGAHTFVRRFFRPPFRYAAFPPELPKPKKGKGVKVPAEQNSEGLNLADVWGLTELFLQEVVGMDRDRIEAIRELGTRLGDRIAHENDKPLFRALYEVRGAGPLRHLLLRATLDKAKQDANREGEKPPLLITDEAYLKVFMEADETARADFTLARDLLKMRVLQVLHEQDFFKKNKDDPELQETALDAGGDEE